MLLCAGTPPGLGSCPQSDMVHICCYQFASLPLNTAFLGVHFCLCKCESRLRMFVAYLLTASIVYYNALLATFNARDSLRDSNNTVSEKCLESLRVNGPTNLPMTYYSHVSSRVLHFAISRLTAFSLDRAEVHSQCPQRTCSISL
jgi:hypothetical protein